MEEQPENFNFDVSITLFNSLRLVAYNTYTSKDFAFLYWEGYEAHYIFLCSVFQPQSGVGKSHLINNAVFGTDFTLFPGQVVQHGRTPEESRLILHDSQGFSRGDAGNFETVKQFIEERIKSSSRCPSSRIDFTQFGIIRVNVLAVDRLCTEIPTFGSASLESAEEEIIDLKDSISTVPIIAILTKYDNVGSLMPPKKEEDLYGDIEEAIGMNDDVDRSANLETLAAEAPSVDPDILSLADSKLSEEFVQTKSGLKDVPWVGVSVWPNYTHKPVKITLDNIVRLLWVITQQSSADLKIHASTK
ncbi:hypothetical protein BT96DRAFT_941955 [Gymnopus androsaceus JB14]|uniref:G domain-containing protein n=1 Tax=Gymnopus androsaceus JB14 TaxID=1447944 RepID=A0A6A4HEL7_9AGAR|nr:hypothetical protein BT96DRAFT_941955 [Gymnopus androsaceus JB14]